MSYSFEYIDIILLAMIAGFIFLRLRGILGKRSGFEGKAPSQLKEVLKMDGNMRLLHNSQWSHAIPQYDIRQAALQKHLSSNTYDKLGLYFSCNYVGGVSLGDCILHGLKTANEITGVQ